MFTLTWTTEKELERVIGNKGDEFRRKKNMEIQSGGEKMGNASGQQGENERQWKIKANMNTTQEAKYWVSTYDNSSIKRCVTRKFHPLVVQNSVAVMQNNGKGKTKKRAARAILFFAN